MTGSSAQCAPDAGFLAVVQRHAGTAWRSASLELDTEHCIMEAELPAEERRWYIRQATARNLSKAELLRMIEDSAYLESVLDEKVDVWYNEGNDEISERTQYEEDPVYLSWQYCCKDKK